jgi:hypothetical protein
MPTETTTAVNVATTTKQVTHFFAPSAKGKRVRTSELELSTPGKTLNLDAVQAMTDDEVTAEMLAACVVRIRALEAELESSNTNKAASGAGSSAAKKARTEAVAQESTTQVVKKQTDMILKRLATGTKQGLKVVKFFSGYDATSRDVKTSDMISKAEFEAVFTGGTLTQPTPQNKPGSKVYIKEYTSQQANELLGTSLSNWKGEQWAKGGAPTRGFGFFGGGGGGFSKGKKLGSATLTVLKLKAQYSLSSQQLAVTVTLINEGALRSMSDDDDCW